jgi:carbon monoxide dehydrogenase subunit G
VAELVVSVDVAAPLERVWAALVDWDSHGEWMLLTTVDRTTHDGNGLGAGIEASTGFGPLIVRDTMTVSQWQPPPAHPARCVVEHTGTIVRGAGAFEIQELSADTSRVVWSEWVRLPFGLLGELGWLVVRPVTAAFLTVSLRRLARVIESQHQSQRS